MRTTCIRTLGIALVMAIGLALAAPAHAVIVNYTVDTWGAQYFPGTIADTPNPAPPPTAQWGVNGYPGDKVELQTYTGSLDLTPGTYTQKINTLLWTGFYTYAGGGDPEHPDANWKQLWFHFNTPRNITIGTATATLTQGGLLECLWADDYLSFSPGLTVSLYVQADQRYRVDITPLGLPAAGAGWWGPVPNGVPLPSRDMMADFVVTEAPIPEPATIIVWSLLGAGGWLGMRVWRRRGNRLDLGGSAGRQPWSNENRTAILELIARGR